jgi:hypothetical protein
MRLSKLFAAACLSLTLAACGGTESADESMQQPEDLSSVGQHVEPVPLCPPGEETIYWTEYGTCGGCTYLRKPGTPVRKYAACSGNVSGTKAVIGNSCQSGCVLEP